MILTKTPLRVSFFGGGSDLPEFYEGRSSTGAVLSTTVDVYMYIALNTSARQRVKVCYDEIEVVEESSFLKHNRVRESLLQFNINSNIEISSFCNVPTKGTGLGSSSTYTVGLCSALNAFTKNNIDPHQLAELAYYIERVRCEESLGRQDQYAAAFGGFNFYEFYDKKVNVEKIECDSLYALEQNLMYFFTGHYRVANQILEKVSSSSNSSKINELVNTAYIGKKLLLSNQLDKFGELLNDAWNIKKSLASGVSNGIIDECYDTALKNGALGGKILGAGGGGFLMLYVPYTYQHRVREAMSKTEMTEYKFKFSKKGSEVIVNDL